MLEKEEVLKVAHLARVRLTEEEIERFRHSLKDLINEIDKIKDVEVEDSFFLSPSDEACALKSDDLIEENSKEDILLNVKSKKGSFIKVPVMVGE